MCVAIGTSNRFDRHACICKIEKKRKTNNSSVCDMNSRFMQFQMEINEYFTTFVAAAKTDFFASLCFDLIWFVFFLLLMRLSMIYDSRFLCVPSLLTYRFFFARFFNDTLSTMTTLCFPYQTQLAERECTTCSLLDAAAERKNANLAPNQLCIAIQHKIDKVQSLIRMIS